MLSGPDLWDVSCFEFWQTTQTISNLKSLLLDVDKIFELFILSSSLPKYFLWLFFWLVLSSMILIDWIDGLLWSNLFVLLNIPCHPLIVTISNDSYDTIILVTWLQGHICGLGAMSGLPHLLVFDITKCLNPGVMFSGCDTPQVRNERLRRLLNLNTSKLVQEILFWIPFHLKSKKIRSFNLAKHWIELSTSTPIVLTFGHERFNI